MLDVGAYLSRIGYTGPTEPTTAVLRNLHRCHMLSVPFENLDIGRGRKIVCDEEFFVRKIVDRRRGGFCYELNGAFAALLRELEFQVTLLSARVPHLDGSDGPEFDHLALRVDLEEPWLADVGFGDSFAEPLRLQPDIEQVEGRRSYRLVEESGVLDLQVREPDAVWKREYDFTLHPRELAEFAPMCHYHQTSPASPFTQKRICSLARPDGRVTLADWKLIQTFGGKTAESLLNSEDEWRAMLKQHFGVVL
jgi:N-hydroxyarylamine O-acetyltransferase